MGKETKEVVRDPFKRPAGKPRRCRLCGELVHPQVRDFCRSCFEQVFPMKKEEATA